MRVLISLMLVNGVTTDADSMPGEEKLVVVPIQEEQFKDYEKTYVTCSHIKYRVGACQLGQVKGWKRTCCAWWIMHSIIKLELVEEIRKTNHPLYDTLKAAHCIVPEYANNVEKQVFSNREADEHPTASQGICVNNCKQSCYTFGL